MQYISCLRFPPRLGEDENLKMGDEWEMLCEKPVNKNNGFRFRVRSETIFLLSIFNRLGTTIKYCLRVCM